MLKVLRVTFYVLVAIAAFCAIITGIYLHLSKDGKKFFFMFGHKIPEQFGEDVVG